MERLNGLLLPEQRDVENLNRQISDLKSVLETSDKTIRHNSDKISELNAQINNLDRMISEKRKQLAVFDADISTLDYGLYKPTFEFANSDLYKEKLGELRDKQKKCIQNDTAAYGDTNWQVNGSAAQGRARVNNYKKLLLRAFNVECDDIVDNVKISNSERSVGRIEKISEQISRLGKTMGIGIAPGYVRLKIDEVNLALDYQQKKLEEKERQKEIRAQEREEAKVLKEIEEESVWKKNKLIMKMR